jgi:hypothetical protein
MSADEVELTTSTIIDSTVASVTTLASTHVPKSPLPHLVEQFLGGGDF